MNKNPFASVPSYPAQQPPLPPGPPPAQAAQPDYSAYWAAAAAAQHPQPPTVGAYNSQWTAPQPAQPPQQSALYANYGYGGQQNYHWQQTQQQQRQQQPQQHYPQPPPPVSQPPPPPPPQPAYNPYQPQAGAYQQPYVPQAGPPPQHPPPYQPQQQQPQQPYYPQQPQQHQPPRHVHQTSPQHLPPAKRQRFDGPNQRGPPPPQFQPPPPPQIPQQQGMYGPGQGQGRGGGPGNQMGRGGGLAGRGGLRGAKSGFINGNRGGGFGNRGARGGGNMYGGNRGGNAGGQPLKNHGSRGGFYGNKDFNNRRGGSFNSGHAHHHPPQQPSVSSSSSFRGRGQGHFTHSARGGRHDFVPREGTMVSTTGPTGKKDENRRTLTDFKIVGLEIKDLGWSWGILPSTASVNADDKPVLSEATNVSDVAVKTEAVEADMVHHSEPVDDAVKTEAASSSLDGGATVDLKPVSAEMRASVAPATLDSSPPSRLRIYFHTPVSPDDSHPISLNSSFSFGSVPPDLRKGKRKKLEDDDGDMEEGRAPPPPPKMSSEMTEMDNMSVSVTADIDGMGRSSLAPSVAETASEGDWLMAAIGEDEGEGEQSQSHENENENGDDNWAQDGEDGNNGYGAEGQGYSDDNHAHESPMENGNYYEEAPESGENGVSTGEHGPDGIKNHAEQSQADAGAPTSASDKEQNGADPCVAAVLSDKMVVETDSLGQSEKAADAHASNDHSSTAAGSLSAHAQGSSQNGESSANVPDDHPQVSAEIGEGAPLQASPTAPDLEFYSQTQTQEVAFSQDGYNGEDNGSYGAQNETSGETQQTQVDSQSDMLGSSTSTTVTAVSTGALKGGKTPSANRLSISYAAGSRRLVVDAQIVDKLKVFRSEGRVEVHLNIDEDEPDDLKGILIEGLSDATKSYLPLPTLSEAANPDTTLPPFSNATVPSKLVMTVYLDTDRPLSEPKWVKTGDVQEWLKSMFGRMFWVAGDAADGWEKRIEVVDPDPAPTIWTVLEGWANNSPVGQPIERQRFLRTHMTETDNIMEILLRLVRGERATPFTQSNSSISAQSVSGPLLAALSPGSPHGAQQTHVSLAVLAIFRMSVEYAKKAVGDKGKGEAEERVGEIIRCLPSHLLYKSLDGIFKEWKVEKKGGR